MNIRRWSLAVCLTLLLVAALVLSVGAAGAMRGRERVKEIEPIAEAARGEGVYLVCSAADTTSAPPQTEAPADAAPSGADIWGSILGVAIPGGLFIGAVLIGYLLGKKYKRH